MATFFVADLQLFSKDAAAECGLEVEEYNKICIDNINNEIKDDDTLMFFGDFSVGNFKETKELMLQMKGKKTIIDRIEELRFSNSVELELMGFTHLWSIGGFHSGIVDRVNYKIIISPLKRNLDFDLRQRDDGYYIVSTSSKLGTDEIYKEKVLNIDFKKWGLCPICIDNLSQMIADCELFNTMEG